MTKESSGSIILMTKESSVSIILVLMTKESSVSIILSLEKKHRITKVFGKGCTHVNVCRPLLLVVPQKA